MGTSDATGLPIYGEALDRELIRNEALAPVESASEPNDEALLLQVQAADMEALGLLFRRYFRTMLGIARRVLRDNDEAEDLVQDVFLFLFFKGKTFDPAKGPARTWLIQVTYHRAYDRRRYLRTRSFYDRAENKSEGSVPTTDSVIHNPEDFLAWQSCLRPAFEALSEDQRKTLALHFYEGYTIREISEKLQQPFGNVQHHFYRGMDRLRKYVSQANRK